MSDRPKKIAVEARRRLRKKGNTRATFAVDVDNGKTDNALPLSYLGVFYSGFSGPVE
jgi:hypothetical protein